MKSTAAFDRLWATLADMLGTAATAALVRRAAKRAAQAGYPEVGQIVILREDLGFRYEVPAAWSDETPEPSPALRALVAELCPLLVELTGSVVVRRLEHVEELRRSGILPEPEKAHAP